MVPASTAAASLTKAASIPCSAARAGLSKRACLPCLFPPCSCHHSVFCAAAPPQHKHNTCVSAYAHTLYKGCRLTGPRCLLEPLVEPAHPRAPRVRRIAALLPRGIDVLHKSMALVRWPTLRAGARLVTFACNGHRRGGHDVQEPRSCGRPPLLASPNSLPVRGSAASRWAHPPLSGWPEWRSTW